MIRPVKIHYSLTPLLISTLDDFGKTPLHYAAQRGANISGLYIMTKGADVNRKDKDGNTPMGVALLSGHQSKIIDVTQPD